MLGPEQSSGEQAIAAHLPVPQISVMPYLKLFIPHTVGICSRGWSSPKGAAGCVSLVVC